MDWSRVDYLWIIVMFLSDVWTLILTAPIHCRGSSFFSSLFAQRFSRCKSLQSSFTENLISTLYLVIAYHWWARDVMQNFSKSVLMNKQTHILYILAGNIWIRSFLVTTKLWGNHCNEGASKFCRIRNCVIYGTYDLVSAKLFRWSIDQCC